MNTIQKQYQEAKEAWEQAAKDYKELQELEAAEDALLDAEEELVTWSIQEAEKAGMSKEDAAFLKDNYHKNAERVIELAMRLEA